MQRWSLAPFLLRLPHIVYPCCSVCPFVSRLLPPLPSWLSEASPTTRVGCLQLNTGNDESIRGGVEGGYTLITLRTDALTNPCQPALMPTVWIHTYRSLSLPLSLSTAFKLHAQCWMPRRPTLGCCMLIFPLTHLLKSQFLGLVSNTIPRNLSSLSHCVSHTLIFHTIFDASPHSVRALCFFFLFFFPESHPHCVLLMHSSVSFEHSWDCEVENSISSQCNKIRSG